jgi:hypothetical protein
MRRDNYVGIMTELRAGRPRNGGAIPGRGTFFSSPKRPDRLLVGHPASYIKGSGISFPNGKAAGALNWPLTRAARPLLPQRGA